MEKPEKKPTLDQRIDLWQKRYMNAVNATLARTRLRHAPPTTDDGVRLATFNDRVFASAVDTVLSMVIFGPVIAVAAKAVHGGRSLQDILNMLQQRHADMVKAALSPEYLAHFALENLISFSLMGLVVVYLWIVSSTTPGKWLLRMRIVDARTYAKPSNRQFIVRYLGYILSLLPAGLGFFWIGWDRKKQAWHDKLAGTLVIRVNHWRFRDSAPVEEAPGGNPPPAA